MPHASALQAPAAAPAAKPRDGPEATPVSAALQERLFRRSVSHVVSFFSKPPAELARRAVDGAVSCTVPRQHVGSFMGQFIAGMQSRGYDVQLTAEAVTVSARV